MKTIRFVSLLAIVAAALCSCGKTADTPAVVGPQIPYDRFSDDTFSGSWVEIEADTDRAISDRPILITTSCLPLISGKGYMQLLCREDSARWIVISPIRDTVTGSERKSHGNFINATEIPITFTANVHCAVPWKIKLEPSNGHAFWVMAVMDSLYYPKLGRYVWIHSSEARSLSFYGIFRDFGMSREDLALRK
ncbi:MAG: hypothetical protein ABI876_07645 [Bacteroidota bacterium]